MIKSYDAVDGFRQSHIGGVLGYPADSNVRRTCDATNSVLAATCEMPYWDSFFQFYWDSENTRWIAALAQGSTTKRDIYEFTSAGMIKKIGTTAADINNGSVYVKLDGVENYYYCSGGRIRRYNLTTKVDMGALSWSMATLNCKGKTMDFNPTNRSLIFPFEQNGLNGVGEYFLPQKLQLPVFTKGKPSPPWSIILKQMVFYQQWS